MRPYHVNGFKFNFFLYFTIFLFPVVDLAVNGLNLVLNAYVNVI